MFEYLENDFKTVIKHSQGIEDPKIDNLFTIWRNSKKKFIERFGGLIYEVPYEVEFNLDPREQNLRIMEFSDEVDRIYHNYELSKFIDANAESFFDNKVSHSGDKNVPKGMKLLKAFRYFEDDKNNLRRLQDAASHVIQENKIKGKLCFSVHPLDFLSSSENSYNWRTCHSLDGDYRAGNLSYMVDRSTFMVYIKGEEECELPHFGPVKWNSKKWRVLMHVSNDDEIMFAGRQYPFNSKSGLDQVLKIYNELMVGKTELYPSENKYGPWKKDYVDMHLSEDNLAPIELQSKYILYDRRLVELPMVVKQGYYAQNFNDILNSHIYKYPYYTIQMRNWYDFGHRMNNPIYIGEEVLCLHCGDNIIHESNTMRCNECELKYGTEENYNYGFCDCCGSRVDSMFLWPCEGELVCEHCLRTECFMCDDCGEYYFNENKNYMIDRVVCDKCYNEGEY